MRYIFYKPGENETEQQKGIKEFLSSRGIYPGDCTILQSDYRFDDSSYELGIQGLISGLSEDDVLYVWDYAFLAKSLEGLYAILLVGINNGVCIVQCLDGTVASNESAESLAIVNAIGIASRIELKVSKVQRIQRFSSLKAPKANISVKNTRDLRQSSNDQKKIVVRRYSEKSVLVCGDSREYKDAIHNLGGIFNPKIDNGRAAWIVSLRKLKQLREALAAADYDVLQDCYISGKDFTK